jgi:hydroxymethylpyrimidine/phosphomethylpyrimidine kinase
MTTDSNAGPVVLAIAGFDPSGNAGVIADISTLLHFDCRPAAAITSMTYQNSKRVFGTHHQSAESLRGQILPLVSEFHIAAVKIGMLPTPKLVREVARLIVELHLPGPVADPVLHSSSGFELMEPAAREIWLGELMPLARLVTPNTLEAEILTGKKINDEADMAIAASVLRERGAQAVLIKGGHLPMKSASSTNLRMDIQAIDLLDEGGAVTIFRDEWIAGASVRGTGCMLSSAIAARLGRQMNLREAVGAAKRFVAERIRSGSGLAPE